MVKIPDKDSGYFGHLHQSPLAITQQRRGATVFLGFMSRSDISTKRFDVTRTSQHKFADEKQQSQLQDNSC